MEVTALSQSLTIGKLAKTAGISVEAIRFYQRRGLLREPKRQLGRNRIYGEEDVLQLWLINQGKKLGFTLEEIKRLASYVSDGNCTAFSALAERKIKALTDRILALESARKRLQSLVTQCGPECGKRSSCSALRVFQTCGFGASHVD